LTDCLFEMHLNMSKFSFSLIRPYPETEESHCNLMFITIFHQHYILFYQEQYNNFQMIFLYGIFLT